MRSNLPKYASNGCPIEDEEEHVLSDYCELKGWLHTHFSNEMYTTSWKQKHKMKYLGVHSGLPDHFILVPVHNKVLTPVYIEMKRQKGGTISDEQYRWVHALRLAGQYATVCAGGGEAIEVVESIYKGDEKAYQQSCEKFDKKYEKWAKKQKTLENGCPF